MGEEAAILLFLIQDIPHSIRSLTRQLLQLFVLVKPYCLLRQMLSPAYLADSITGTAGM